MNKAPIQLKGFQKNMIPEGKTEFFIGTLPGRTGIDCDLDFVTKTTKNESYYCLDCKFKTTSLVEITKHQLKRTIFHKLRKWF